MSAKKQNGIFLFVMTMLLFAVWGFAAEIDCFDKSNNYYKKNYCVYMPLDVSAHAGLFVIDANTKDTLPNSPLYVYAPDAGPDSVVLISGEPPAALSHKQLSQSGPDGILHLAVVGHFPKKICSVIRLVEYSYMFPIIILTGHRVADREVGVYSIATQVKPAFVSIGNVQP